MKAYGGSEYINPHYLDLGIIWRSADSFMSVVGIATGHGLDDRGIGVRVPVGKIILT
jgi:hypothetical protein